MISVDQQRALYREYAHLALPLIAARLTTDAQRLITLGETRAFDTVGVEQYGDSSFHLTTAEASNELDAELADAVFYAVLQVARRHGWTPPPSV